MLCALPQTSSWRFACPSALAPNQRHDTAMHVQPASTSANSRVLPCCHCVICAISTRALLYAMDWQVKRLEFKSDAKKKARAAKGEAKGGVGAEASSAAEGKKSR